MIRIDLNTFNLIYTRKSDGRKFLCKGVTKYEYVLIDTVTGEVLRSITQYLLRRDYRPLKRVNKSNKKKRPFMNYGKRRIA